MRSKANILIVEDDEAIATGLSMNLKLEGYRPAVAHDGEAALEAIRSDPSPDLILLDMSMPKKDGIEVLTDLRQSGDQTPVIVLSAREDEYDKVAALRLGADDYVTKPFALAELMARVAAVLRRASPSSDELPHAATSRTFGEVTIDLASRKVTRGGKPVKLTHLEFELLAYLVDNPERVLSRDLLLRDVWGLRGSGSRRTIDNFIAQLRGKLETDPENPRHIVTVRGSGYRFMP